MGIKNSTIERGQEILECVSGDGRGSPADIFQSSGMEASQCALAQGSFAALGCIAALAQVVHCCTCTGWCIAALAPGSACLDQLVRVSKL